MKKIFQLTSILAVLSLLVLSCSRKELSTDQYDSAKVVLQAYGPQPVVRGGTLRFVGSNLDQVATVTIPGVEPLAPEVVTSGVHSEIRVTVPKDGPVPGFPVLTLQDGTTLTGKTQITFDEPISIEEFTSGTIYPGETLTIKGDYFNLIHEIVFASKVKVSEDEFISHSRYEIKVAVPEEAQTGKFSLGTVDETKIDAESADDKALLATLNLIESETDLTVGTAAGVFPEEAIKAYEEIAISGSHLLLVEDITIGGNYSVTEFEATDSEITFELSALAPDGEVALVMASGVSVPIGTLTTVAPSELAVSPAPIKAGAVLTVTGKDLDLVDNIVVGGEGLSDFDREATGTEISFPVPEKAVEGDVVLIMVNRKQVSVPFTLVKPEVTGFSANPAAAGSPITIEGTDLDLVAAVTFGGGVKVNVEATETAITVSVPTTAESGDLILNLKNGTTLSAGKLEVDKPVACYILTDLSEMEIHGGSVVTVEVANESVLTGVQVNGEAVQYILNGNALFICMPAMAGSGTIIRLESSNGAVEYTVEAIPATIIETVVMNQERNLGSWANEEAGGAFRLYKADLTAAGFAEGVILRFYVSQFAYAQLQINDANWGQIAIPQFGEGEAPETIDVEVDAAFYAKVMETSDGWGDTGMVVQGEGLVVKKVSVVVDNSETVLMNQERNLGSWANEEAGGAFRIYKADLAAAGIKPGKTLRFYVSQFAFAQLQINDANWGQIACPKFDKGAAPAIIDVVMDADFCTTVMETSDGWGDTAMVVQGEGLIVTKVTLK